MKDLKIKSVRKKAAVIFAELLITYISGILIAYPIRISLNVFWLATCFGSLFCLLLTLNLAYKKWNTRSYKGLIKLLLLLLTIMGGVLSCVLHDDRTSTDYYAHKASEYLKVRVNDEPRLKNGLMSFEVQVLRGYTRQQEYHACGKLMVLLKANPSDNLKLEYGQELIIPSRHSPINPPRNPGEFDYKSWLAARNIHYQVFLRTDELIKLNAESGNPIIAFALNLRKKQVDYYRRFITDSVIFSVATTLILGYRADLDEETLSVYSRTGTIHALSVSGMHVGLIYLVLDWLLKFLGRGKWLRFLKLTLTVALIWAYSLLTGMSPSVLRAAIMLSVLIFSKAFSRQHNSYNILAFAAFSLLLFDPYLIWDMGFQLSFLAVLGLIWLQPIIQGIWKPEKKWVAKLWNSVAMSLAAQLSTFPLSIYYFHQFPLYFLLSNLFILLPSAMIMYLGIIILLLRLDFLMQIFEALIRFMNLGLSWISYLPAASLSGIWINKTDLILLSVSITSIVIAYDKKSKTYLYIGLSCACLLQLSFSLEEIGQENQKKIIVFALRKHHATAFITSNEAYVISDLEIRDKNFSRHILPALDSHRVERVNFLRPEKDTAAMNFSLRGRHIRFYQYELDYEVLSKPLPFNSQAIEISIQ